MQFDGTGRSSDSEMLRLVARMLQGPIVVQNGDVQQDAEMNKVVNQFLVSSPVCRTFGRARSVFFWCVLPPQGHPQFPQECSVNDESFLVFRATCCIFFSARLERSAAFEDKVCVKCKMT